MADLSKMLGDVYGEAETEPAPAPAARAPEWADDERLDEAFDGWTPGPSADASPTERRLFAGRPDDDPAPLADDLATALSEAVLAETSDDEADEPVATDQVENDVAAVPYTPRKNAFDFAAPSNDDDIYKAMAILRGAEAEEQARAASPTPAREEPIAPIEPTEAVAPAPLEPMDLEPAVSVAPSGPWQRDDDDILPRRGGKARRGLQLSFRRR